MTKPGARTADGEAPRAASADRIGTRPRPVGGGYARCGRRVRCCHIGCCCRGGGIAMPALFAMVASDYFAKKNSRVLRYRMKTPNEWLT
jgi:hypothetical protein